MPSLDLHLIHPVLALGRALLSLAVHRQVLIYQELARRNRPIHQLPVHLPLEGGL